MTNNKIELAVKYTPDVELTQELLLDYLAATTPNLDDKQRKQFLAIAGSNGLNPWKREVYAVTYKNRDNTTTMSVVTGFEVYLKRAEMNPAYNGYEVTMKGSFSRKTVTNQWGKAETGLYPDGEVSCICTVHRKDRDFAISDEVYFDEYAQNNSMWKTKPRTMLKKVAIVSAFRKAFPLDFGGMPYTSDELPDKMTNGGVMPEVPERAESAQGAHQEAIEVEAVQVDSAANEKPAEGAQEAPAEISERKKKFIESCKLLDSGSCADVLNMYGLKKFEDVPEEQLGDFYRDVKRAAEAKNSEVEF